MVDIHCHALYGVDDGADNIEESVAMLKQAKSQGVEAVVLTPHYRHGMFPYNKEKIKEHFEKLKPLAEDLGVDVYLGCEYHVNSRITEALTSGRCLSLAGGDFVLTEYSFETEYSYINEQTRRLLSYGYIPVIDSILGLAGKTAEKFCKKLLRHEWADIVASDAHGMKERASHLGECREHIVKKYGEDYAELLLEKNPRRIIRDS